MKWLNYHHLLYFREIAREQSVSRAAEKLRLGQPTLSTQLRKLEEQLGHRLFDRRGRRLQLTDAGSLVLRYANEIHQSGEALMDVIDRGVLASRLQLHVGVLDSVPKHLVLNLISEARALGGSQVSVHLGPATELLSRLQTHELDFIVTDHPAPISEGPAVRSRSLAKTPIVAFAATRHTDLRTDFPRSLEGQPFIVPTLHSRLRHEIEHYLRERDLTVDFIVETQDTAIQKLLAVEGQGVVALPQFPTIDLVQEGKLIALGNMEGIREEFWIVSIKRVIENPIATRLIGEFSFSF